MGQLNHLSTEICWKHRGVIFKKSKEEESFNDNNNVLRSLKLFSFIFHQQNNLFLNVINKGFNKQFDNW